MKCLLSNILILFFLPTVVYDEAAVEKLLDRSQKGEEIRESGMNDYLRSFKVATYQMKEDEEVWDIKCGSSSATLDCNIERERERERFNAMQTTKVLFTTMAICHSAIYSLLGIPSVGRDVL